MMSLTKLAEAAARQDRIDPLARQAQRLAERVVGSRRARRVLSGDIVLGHPLHPALTDLPIGFWTSAMVLDVMGGRRNARAARLLIGAGVVSVPAVALTGWSDYSTIDDRAVRRVGAVHAATNTLATVAYATSWWLRGRDRWIAGFVTSVVGATLATGGAALGGALVFDDELADEEGKPAGHLGSADRPPTPDEEEAAEGLEVSETSASAYREMARIGADIEGEGRID